MSTHVDPTKDKYLELEKKLGIAEYQLAADIAADDKAMKGRIKVSWARARSLIGNIRGSRGKSHA